MYCCISLLLHSRTDSLPLQSQFALDQDLWDSDIGEAASSVAKFDRWKLIAGIVPDSSSNRNEGSTKKRRRRKAVEIEKKVKEWCVGTKKPVLQSFVRVPTKELVALWNRDLDLRPTDEEKEAAKTCMERVHSAHKTLRLCYTEHAIERACIQVAAALLEMAMEPACSDPFMCLQQAAMFASQGAKGGDSETCFRGTLPDVGTCTPLQALNILGRADCLHNIFFAKEAAYLCSYVARVCRGHRVIEAPELEWNPQWVIVAICAYNVSAMIRSTVRTVLDKGHQLSGFMNLWESDVVEELEHGRRDGWSWNRRLYKTKTLTDETDLEKSLDGCPSESEESEGEEEDVVQEREDNAIDVASTTGQVVASLHATAMDMTNGKSTTGGIGMTVDFSTHAPFESISTHFGDHTEVTEMAEV